MKKISDAPSGGTGFDAGMIACLTLLILGGYADGWAHNNISGLDTFFTPWHAMLYSGFAISALYLIVAAVRWHSRGYSWLTCLPRGYGVAAIGVAIFGLGGALDMLWHLTFGIEVDVAALVSPTHLMLLLGVALMYLGPLRAALIRNDTATGIAALPKILSLTYFWASLTFFTQYASPFGDTSSAASYEHSGDALVYFLQAIGIASLLLQTAFMMGCVLYAAARFALPPGSLTVMLTLQTILMTVMRHADIKTGPVAVILAALVAGLLCDTIYAQLAPAPNKKRAWLVFATIVPFVTFALYFAAVTVLAGTWWPVHLIAGAPVEAAGIGFLLGWLTLDRES